MNRSFTLISKKSKEEIYFQFAESMMLLCLRYMGNKEEAEEVMNNGFLKAFNHLKEFKELHEFSFRAWLKKIMINECLMHLRKNNDFNIISLEEASRNNRSEISEQSYDVEYLLKALEELPIGYRTVFNMYAVEGFAHKEIAEMLNISESTSRTQLLKARKLLQNKICIQDIKYGF